jgi:hypothetical protein
MTDALRFILGLLPWLFVAALIGAECWGRRGRSALTYLGVAVASGGAALAASILAAKQVPVVRAEALAQSGILDMDLDRTVAVLRWWGHGYYRTSVHPLICLLFQPPAALVAQLTGAGDFRAAQLTCGLSLTASAVLVALTVLKAKARVAPALATAILYVASFAFLLHAGLPESASLAAPTIALPAFLFAFFRDREPSARERALWIGSGVLALGVTVTNVVVPLIFYALRVRERRAGVAAILRRIALVAASIAGAGVVLALAQRALYPGSALWFLPTSFLEEGSFVRGEFGPARVVSVVVQVLGYALIGPRFVATDSLARKGLVAPALSAQELPLSALPGLAIALLVAELAWAVWAIRSARKDSLAAGALLAVSFNLVLHLVYGNEFVLYSANWAALLALGLGLAVASRSALVSLGVVVAAALLAFNNAAALSQLHAMTRDHGARASLHLPLGSPGSHELSRSFVAWDGSYSPGIGTSGVHLAVWDPATRETNVSSLVRGTDGVRYGLGDGWKPEAIIESRAGALRVEQVTMATDGGVYTRLRVSADRGGAPARARVLALISGAGPAGTGAARAYVASPGNREITVDGQPVLTYGRAPGRVETVLEERGVSLLLSGGEAPPGSSLISRIRERVRGMLGRTDAAKPTAVLASWDIEIPPGRDLDLELGSPIALAPHLRKGPDDAADYVPSRAGAPTPQDVDAFWASRLGSIALQLPDPDWTQGMLASAAQLALSVQAAGRIPVSPVNYGPFTRDAAYMIEGLIVTGQLAAAREALDYLFAHPWSGRPSPEGDTPGHLLWVAGSYVEFSHDLDWLHRRARDIRNLAAAVQAMRSNGIEAVEVDVLGQKRRIEPGPAGGALQRRLGSAPLPRLNYGTMDGGGLLYVNLISVTGLENAVDLLRAAGDSAGADAALENRNDLAEQLSAVMNALGHDFAWDARGECAALWPARFDRFDSGAREFFVERSRSLAGRPASSWPYLDLDAAHNRLAAGVREAGWQTVRRYLDDPNFRRWRILDEGGASDRGYWPALETNPPWPPRVASPHGWSHASLLLLMRDCLLYEDRGQLVLLPGIPPEWWAPRPAWRFVLPTTYGPVDVQVEADAESARVSVGEGCRPPAGFQLRLPEGFESVELHADAAPFRWTIRRRSH